MTTAARLGNPRPGRGALDVVYVVRDGDNEELRTSLRSLVNLPHRNVWVVGGGPGWLRNVGRIPVEQTGDRFANVLDKITAACEHAAISDEFVWFDDDMTVLHPVESMPVLHGGPLVEAIATRSASDPFRVAMQSTADALAAAGLTAPLSYEPHVPMVMHKARTLAAIAAAGSVRPVLARSLYGNLFRLGGTRDPDVKIRRPDEMPPDGAAFVSTDDVTYHGTPAGAFLRAAFPNPSPYESGAPTMYRMLISISGTRNGQDWPKRGELVDLPADEAEAMIKCGHVERANEAAPAPVGPPSPFTVEAATAPAAETATVNTRPRKR